MIWKTIWRRMEDQRSNSRHIEGEWYLTNDNLKKNVEDACCIWKRLISKRLPWCSEGHIMVWIYVQNIQVDIICTVYLYLISIYMTINYYCMLVTGMPSQASNCLNFNIHFPIIQPIFTRIFLSRGLTKRSKVAIDPKVNAREIGKSKRSSNKLTRVASNLGAIWGI